ncbi:MAG: hypothetical protein ABEJ74_08650 [Haloferacaceae archaeon]
MHDDRGVSEVLGAMLIFGLVLAMVVLIQVAAVPALNQQIEFSHNQRVQGDVQLLGEHVDYTAATGAETSTTMEMGVFYPTRIFLLNPPPASATLSTEETSMTLENVESSGETGDYWNGDARTFDSTRLTYAPDYNEYDSAPDTVLEGWALFDEHEAAGTDTALDETSPVNGKRIRLVALDGSRSETSVSPVTVTAEPLSVPEQPVAVSDDGQAIVLRLQTQLSEETWGKILEEETCVDSNNDNVCDPGQPSTAGHIVDWRVVNDQLRVVLEKGVTYELRLSKVGLGSKVTREGPYYMTAIDPPSVVQPGGSDLTVEVRDRYNTAKSGVDVTFTAANGNAQFGSGGSMTTVTTDEDGQATIRAIPTTSDPVTIVAKADLDGNGTVEAREQVNFTALPVSTSFPHDPSEINPHGDNDVILTGARIVSEKDKGNTVYYVDVTWDNTADDPVNISAVRLNFYQNNEISTGGGQLEYVDQFRVDNTPWIDIRAPYHNNPAVSPNPIPANDDGVYRFEFKNDAGTNFVPEQGDFFVVTLKFDTGQTGRYFVDPR